MKTVDISYAQLHLSQLIDAAAQGEDIVITRRNAEAAVMISLDEYNSMMETLHLLRSPENARRLRRAIDQLAAGKGTEVDLDI